MIDGQIILRLALILPPILGFFLLGGGSYFISPIVSPFFLVVTKNSAPNVSPPLKLNSDCFFLIRPEVREDVSQANQFTQCFRGYYLRDSWQLRARSHDYVKFGDFSMFSRSFQVVVTIDMPFKLIVMVSTNCYASKATFNVVAFGSRAQLLDVSYLSCSLLLSSFIKVSAARLILNRCENSAAFSLI